MSDIKLFRYSNTTASELAGKSAAIERDLQRLIESQMDTFLGVRFLASEYGTGAKHRGRVDSLGLDENGCPVIIEYKRHSNENVINQGLLSGLAARPQSRFPSAGDGQAGQGRGGPDRVERYPAAMHRGGLHPLL